MCQIKSGYQLKLSTNRPRALVGTSRKSADLKMHMTKVMIPIKDSLEVEWDLQKLVCQP